MKIETFEKAIIENDLNIVRQGLEDNPAFANRMGSQYLLFQTAVYQLKLTGKENPDEHKKMVEDRLAIVELFIKHGAQSLTVSDQPGFNIFQICLYRACYLYNDKRVQSARCHLRAAEMIYEDAKSRNDNDALTKMRDSINGMLTTTRGKLVGKAHNLFHMAVYFGYYPALEFILKFRPDPTLSNSFNLPPLHLAILAYAYSDKLDENFKSTQELAAQKAERVKIVELILNYILQLDKENPSLLYQNLLSQTWNGSWPVINDPIITWWNKYHSQNDETPIMIATNSKCPTLVGLLSTYLTKAALQKANADQVDPDSDAQRKNAPQAAERSTSSSASLQVEQAETHFAPSIQQVVVVHQDLQPTMRVIPVLVNDNDDDPENNQLLQPGANPRKEPLQPKNSQAKIPLAKQVRKFTAAPDVDNALPDDKSEHAEFNPVI